MSQGRRVLAAVRLASWVAALVAAGRALVAIGHDSLAIPLTSLDDLAAWVEVASPAEMAMGILRLLAIAACAYLLAVTAIGVVARLAGLRGLVAAIDRVSPAIVRRLVASGGGAGLVVGSLVASVPVPDLFADPPAATVAAGTAGDAMAEPAASATMTRTAPGTATMARTEPGAAPRPAGSATMTRVDTAGPDDGTSATATAGPVDTDGTADDTSATATMHRVPSPTAAPTGTAPGTTTPEPAPTAPPTSSPPAATIPPVVPSTPPVSAAPVDTPSRALPQNTQTTGSRVPGPSLPEAPPLPHADASTWVVEPGDSLWSIAVEVVRGSRPDAGDRDISRYWQRLIDANRADLVDPANPDLLVPGQPLSLPEHPG